MIVLPTLREWRGTNQRQVNYMTHTSNPFVSPFCHPNNVIPSSDNGSNAENLIVSITFKALWFEDEEVSVLIEDRLTLDSTMKDIVREGDVLNELGATNEAHAYKALIQKKSGGKLTLKWSQFEKITMKKFMRLQNVHEDYIVSFKLIEL